jgi:hypothetical protein
MLQAPDDLERMFELLQAIFQEYQQNLLKSKDS